MTRNLPEARTTSTAPTRRRRPVPLLWVIVALVAGLLLGGCGSSSGAGGTPDLAGKTFTSTEVRGTELVSGSSVTLSFEDGRISANAGCNTMNGAATWDTGKLVVTGPMASTMMACSEALTKQDQWLSSFLTSSPALTLDGDTLTLGDATSGMTLTAKK
jgi:heat shock protein HslJ